MQGGAVLEGWGVGSEVEAEAVGRGPETVQTGLMMGSCVCAVVVVAVVVGLPRGVSPVRLGSQSTP